jgi:phosphoribosylformimino-5-aminoimidazole carboxamide ribonucleotide (ProFAR) isomerase
MLAGSNVDETRAVAQASGVRITASGGISSLPDLERLVNANERLIDSVIVGKALYEGKFTLAEAQRILGNVDSELPKQG